MITITHRVCCLLPCLFIVILLFVECTNEYLIWLVFSYWFNFPAINITTNYNIKICVHFIKVKPFNFITDNRLGNAVVLRDNTTIELIKSNGNLVNKLKSCLNTLWMTSINTWMWKSRVKVNRVKGVTRSTTTCHLIVWDLFKYCRLIPNCFLIYNTI